MSLQVPKIVYPGGNFTFVYPPRLQPFKTYQAVRHDNVASSGDVEKIFERIDEFLIVNMEFVKAGSDVAAWDTFIRVALAGDSFDYYPDSTLSNFSTYTLEDVDWNPAFKQLGMYTFSLKFRKDVTATTRIGECMSVLENVAALVALAVPEFVVSYQVLGYYAPGDGGDGVYVWNATDTRADNRGSILQPDSLPSTGRWNLL